MGCTMTFFRHLFRKKKNGDRRSIYCLGFKIFEYSRKKTVYRDQIDRQALSAEISEFHDLGITPPLPRVVGGGGGCVTGVISCPNGLFAFCLVFIVDADIKTG